ncbi:MAG: DUF3857 domain-containing transglutaminase family protein [Candidatus Zixiibacteriota bacterium]
MLRKSFPLLILLWVVLFLGCGGGMGKFIKEDPQAASDEIFAKIHTAGDRNDYPNADVVVIEDIDSVYYDSTGVFDNYNYSLTKILTMKEAREMSEVSMGYDSQVMDLQVKFIRIIKPDSTVILVSDSSIVDETMPGYSEMDIFWSNLRQKTINLPKLQMGDAIEMVVRYKGLQPYFHGIIDGSHAFQGDSPILMSRSVAIIPENMPIDWKVYNDDEGKVQFEKNTKDGHTKYVWEGRDFPQIIMEPGVQAKNITTMLLFSNTTWEELSQEAYSLSAPMMNIGTEIKAKVDELIKDKKTEREKVMALHYYVAQDIRYIGVSLGAKEGITPHDVNETFKNKGGVCKDKSALLTAMLEYAGIEAYDALTNPQSEVLPEIASNQFNHMVVVARLKTGEEIFLDVTDEFCRDGLPGYYSHRGYLPMSKQGHDLEYIPIIPPEDNMGTIKADTKIDDRGTLTSTVTIEGTGIYDEVMRQLRMLDKSDMDRLFERMVSGIHPAAEITNWKIEPDPLSNLWIPAKMTIEYEIPDYAIVAGDYLLLKAPLSLGSFDLIVGGFLQQYTSIETRKYPFEIMLTMGLEVHEKIEMADIYRPRVLPDEVDLEHEIGSIDYDYKIDGKRISFDLSLRINDSKIKLNQYKGLREVSKNLSKAGDGQVILVKQGGQS